MATVSAFLLAKPPTNKPHAISRVLICSINSVQDVRRKITQNGTFRSIGRNFKFVVIGKDRRCATEGESSKFHALCDLNYPL
jgi:hypothetical protein